ncbi:MAG TPA: acyl-CoA dehydrogenase family protein, partial [Pseudorhodoplanes sp.]|nr:acyl-CoA dehydrogenase family protein [Pseudorhodoplanes sp.]
MDFNDTPEEAAFRSEVRAFLDKNTTRKGPARAWVDGPVDLARSKQWQAKKADAGFAAILLPKEFGGRGGTPIQQVIYDQEEQGYRVPAGRVFMITLGMCVPTMIRYATPEQLNRYVKPAIRGEEIWCQLFSEPSGGSDLAGLRTKAERRGDSWIINGQKIWTSGAHYADFGLLLTRTDFSVPKHEGLTAFFIDMKAPGVKTQPIKQISGDSQFNEVFFSDLVVPDSHRLGNVGEGWKVALHTLMNERVAVARADGPDFDEVLALARVVDMDGRPAIENAAVRHQLARWYCNTQGLKHTMSRVITALSKGRAPGPEASIMKVVGAGQVLETTAYGLDLLGPAGCASDSDLVPMNGYFENYFLRVPGERIGGGTEEIMLNIIAERVLKLPGDLRADK